MASLDRVTAALSRLPGIGRRSAERMALRLVLDRQKLLPELIASLEAARDQLCCCRMCGSVTEIERDPCALCTDPARDAALLCVVETPNDILLLERSGGFRGRYHALMGKLSPMRGDGVSDLRVDVLMKRMAGGNFKEVILALSTDVEGDATAAFLSEQLTAQGARVTRLAAGLPSGSGIMYADALTLSRAVQGRTPVGEPGAHARRSTGYGDDFF